MLFQKLPLLFFVCIFACLACEEILPPDAPPKPTEQIELVRWGKIPFNIDDALVMQEIILANIKYCKNGIQEYSSQGILSLTDQDIYANKAGQIVDLRLRVYGVDMDRFDLNLLKNLKGLRAVSLGNVTGKELEIICSLNGVTKKIHMDKKVLESISPNKKLPCDIMLGWHSNYEKPLDPYPYE